MLEGCAPSKDTRKSRKKPTESRFPGKFRSSIICHHLPLDTRRCEQARGWSLEVRGKGYGSDMMIPVRQWSEYGCVDVHVDDIIKRVSIERRGLRG